MSSNIKLEVSADDGHYRVVAAETLELLATAETADEVVDAMSTALAVIERHEQCQFCYLYGCEGRDGGECPQETMVNSLTDLWQDLRHPAAAEPDANS